MKFTAIASVISLLCAMGANAQVPTAKTREQVRNELAEAIRTGDIATGESSLTLRDLYPQRYPAGPTAVGKTREQVADELREAIRTDDIVGDGDSSLKLNELYPTRYPTASAAVANSMQQAASANRPAMP